MLSAYRSRLASLGSARSTELAALGLGMALALGFGVGLGGCTPKIGGSCQLSTDCSSQGDRVCDTAQPDGYCTVQGCKPNECPDQAACVDFSAAIPGCMYSDRDPSRLSVSFCMAQCRSNSDCRESEGYICADPRLGPWNALILDDDQTQLTCIPRPDPGIVVGGEAGGATFDAAVCQLVSPILPDDASSTVPDDGGDGGGSNDAGSGGDATVDSGPSDAGPG